jgi:hypothetical protein
MNSYSKSADIKIVVDQRIELLAIVQTLSNYQEKFGLLTGFDFPYKRDVILFFSPYKKHPAIEIFNKMSSNSFNFDAPPTLMLYLSNPPQLELELPLTDYLINRGGGEEQLLDFIKALRDFARESQFELFWNSHKGTYEEIVAYVQKQIKGNEYIADIEEYYGMNQNSYTIILSPLFQSGGYGPRVERKTGLYDIYNITGTNSIENGFPRFGSSDHLKYIAWHEFSHSFVNPITSNYSKEINKYTKLYSPISNHMRSQAYPDWETCVNEHIVRAITIRLSYLKINQEAEDNALLNERKLGFFYVPALCEQLKHYESNRYKFKTFVDFYPELINVFEDLANKDLGKDFYFIPFEGTINAVGFDKNSVIIIIPTNEQDPEVQKNIHDFVNEYHKFYPESPIITDVEAIKRELSEYSLIVFGTMEGNQWLKENSSIFPFKIEPDGIVADTVYEGADLRFISAWPNPQNPERGLLVYTAQQAKDIIRINSVFHGPTDYVVAKERSIIKAGNYNKKKKYWSF